MAASATPIPLEAKRRAPPLRGDLVSRMRLTRPLLGSADLPLALLVAPPGYGKTTLLSQWAEQDRRAFAWVTLDESENDPAQLLASIVSVLNAIEPVEAGADRAPSTLLRAIERRSRSFVLVLDDVHALQTPESLEILAAITHQLPRGSQLALAGRNEPRIPVGRMRANRNVCELRADDLAMTRSEAGELLTMAGVTLQNDDVETILERTEGWAAGLYLAALSVRESPDPAAGVARFGGNHRLVVDYLREEVLSGLSRDRVSFLTRAAVLDEVSGPLCDAVLERSGSARVLAGLARSHVMVFPTRDAGWYRCHRLLAEMLRSELRRSEPEREPGLHRRAADWYAVNGDIDSAVDHAIAARDGGLAGDLLWAHLPRYVAYGHNDRVQNWLDRFTDDEIAAHPALAVVASFSQFARGDGNLTEHWAAAAAGRLGDATKTSAPALEAGIAIMRAGVGDGPTRMLEDAERAYRLFADEDPWRSICCLLVGAAHHLSGERRRARLWLEEGARRGAVGAPSIQALCHAQLALIAIEEDDWAEATALTIRARAQVERLRLGAYPTSALVYAVSAATHAHDARVDDAEIDARRAMELAGSLTDFAAWYEVEVRITLARAALRLSDVVAADSHLANAAFLLRRLPEAVVPAGWLEDAWIRTDSARDSSGAGDWSLTTSELRVLHFLPTHRSLPEVARVLNVSPNTVKTHTRALYRKLDVSSRSEAVARARAAGLIEPSPFLAEAA